jgi:hypothetical protein
MAATTATKPNVSRNVVNFRAMKILLIYQFFAGSGTT